MAGRDANYYGNYVGGSDIMLGEHPIRYNYLFLQTKPFLYDLYNDRWEAYMENSSLNGREETFCLNVAGGAMSDSAAARLAGYCRDNPQNAHTMVFYLYKRKRVRDRIAWLRAQATDKAIMDLTQVKIVLSQIARACLKDYRDSSGKFRPLDDDTPNPSAVVEVIYKFDPIKRLPYVASLHLHDPLPAIAELCRLEGAYKKPGSSVAVAPIVSVPVDQVRAKLLAKIETAVGHQTDNTIESGDMNSELEDGCSEVPNNKILEVNNG